MQRSPKEDLSIWTVYCGPVDFPGKYVARRWVVGSAPTPVPSDEVFLADDLDALRALLPEGLHRLPALGGDDPCIVECWI